MVSGIGIRNLLDVYVFLGKYEGELKEGEHPEIAVIGQDLIIGDGVVVAAVCCCF